MVQCRGCPKKAANMWSCISNVIGRAKPHKPAINDGISPDSINNFFQNVAVTSDHRSANCSTLPSMSSSANALYFYEI